MTQRFEYQDERSSKFWEVKVDGDSHTVCYGRIGSDGTKKTKSFPDAVAAQKDADKLIKAKCKKGYVAVEANASTDSGATHGIDKAADQFASSLVTALKEHEGELAGPISHLIFPVMQTAITPWTALIFVNKSDDEIADQCFDGGECDLQVSCSYTSESIPGSVDDDDPMLEGLAKESGFDADLLSWGSRPSIPLAAFRAELHRALSGARSELVSAGMANKKTVLRFVDDEADVLLDLKHKDDFGKGLKKRLKQAGIPNSAIAGLAQALYATEARQAWFLG